MMVRILIETAVDDRADAEQSLVDLLSASNQIASRVWIAVDHPQPQDAVAMWRSIASNEDPHRPGHAAISPTPSKPL
jgi:hypothetical protein